MYRWKKGGASGQSIRYSIVGDVNAHVRILVIEVFPSVALNSIPVTLNSIPVSLKIYCVYFNVMLFGIPFFLLSSFSKQVLTNFSLFISLIAKTLQA